MIIDGTPEFCQVYMRTVPGRHDANSRLIAAAPELLEALRMAREYIQINRDSLVETCTGPDGAIEPADAALVAEDDAKLAQIDAAIAKATGGAA